MDSIDSLANHQFKQLINKLPRNIESCRTKVVNRLLGAFAYLHYLIVSSRTMSRAAW